MGHMTPIYMVNVTTGGCVNYGVYSVVRLFVIIATINLYCFMFIGLYFGRRE